MFFLQVGTWKNDTTIVSKLKLNLTLVKSTLQGWDNETRSICNKDCLPNHYKSYEARMRQCEEYSSHLGLPLLLFVFEVWPVDVHQDWQRGKVRQEIEAKERFAPSVAWSAQSCRSQMRISWCAYPFSPSYCLHSPSTPSCLVQLLSSLPSLPSSLLLSSIASENRLLSPAAAHSRTSEC